MHLAGNVGNLESPFFRFLKVLVMSVAGQIVSQQVVQVSIQLTGSHLSRILQFQGTRSCVAWIGEQRFLPAFPFPVQFLENHPGHQDLSADFKHIRITLSVQFQRDGTYRLHIVGHVIPLCTVTTCHGTHQSAMLIGEGNGSSVKLHFTANLEILVQCLAHPFIKFRYLGLRICIAQREHRVFMFDLRKVLVDVASHPHCRRILIHVLRMTCLQFLQFPHQVIKFLVRNYRSIQHVIIIIMKMKFFTQLVNSFYICHSIHMMFHAKLRKMSGIRYVVQRNLCTFAKNNKRL